MMNRALLSLLVAGCIACTDEPTVDEVTSTDDTDDTGATTDPSFQFATDAASAYTRVDRVGMPAINTAVITSKDAYNAADPTDDMAGTFVAEITTNLTALHAALDDDLTKAGLTPCAVKDCVAQAAPLVVPDSLAIDPSAGAGFPNGRLPADPVMDVTLAVVLLDLGTHAVDLLATLPLNPAANDVAFPSAFPYLSQPH